MAEKRILTVIGTRPEAIKMAMVARALDAAKGVEHRICATAQHREMLDSVLSVFELRPDYDLDVMVPDQDLTHTTNAVLTGMAPILADFQPDRLLVQGDTTTTVAAALAAFYAKVPVGHVEAGLRSGDPAMPWPEEMNRQLTDRLSDRHYAPTQQARKNLLAEGFDDDGILVTGNTGIDALLYVKQRLNDDPKLRGSACAGVPWRREASRRMILVTAHRRENLGPGLERVCAALKRLAMRDDVDIVYPVHPNPNVSGPVRSALADHPRIHLMSPVDYVSFVYLMVEAYIIITDSGGIQEEAPSVGRPVLVMRDLTERPEGVRAGTARLVGTNPDCIVSAAERLLDGEDVYAAMSRVHNPYGDGRAGGRIVETLAVADPFG